ncbi:MAG: M81 family metallopeptidase [Chloroflexi bacterium]|nr:M81 family metallopeptidase [Chloroflexota bacterium]
MRIAIGGIANESCTFSSLPSTLEDFRIYRQDAPQFGELYPFLPAFPEAEFFGTVTAKALPGGPVDPGAYNTIKSELLERLEPLLPLDGVYLDMHGALYVSGMEDAEGDWISAIRQLVGADCLISASYDLHGNVSERIMDKLDIITGYRTAPHIDTIETRERAVALLLRCLREDIRPHKAFAKIPVGLPGEKTSTEWEPGKSIYEAIPAEIDGEAVMDATIQVGYVWADEPRMTACVIALGQDKSATAAAAHRLAERYWQHRADFRFGVEALSVDDCLQRAMADPVKPVVISDSGDNITAGGAGDVTAFLERALQHQPADLVYASITDAAAVKRCHDAGAGATLDLAIGGKLDRQNSRPLAISGTVETIKPDARNPQVVLNSNGIRVILTARRASFQRRQQFLDLNISPEAHQIIVIKIGYLVPELKAMAKRNILALSPGAVNQDLLALNYRRISRPCYPFDADMEWAPTVQLF